MTPDGEILPTYQFNILPINKIKYLYYSTLHI